MILSAQATDKSVNLATRALFKHANTPQAILELGVAGLSRVHQDDRAVQHESEERHRDCAASCSSSTAARCPRSREALEALPGVGRKTANVILNTAFGQPTIAVDTHIFRVANRTGLAPGNDVREVEEHLLKVVPPEYAHECAPLADPARPLHVHRAQAEMPAVPDPGAVRVPREDARGARAIRNKKR